MPSTHHSGICEVCTRSFTDVRQRCRCTLAACHPAFDGARSLALCIFCCTHQACHSCGQCVSTARTCACPPSPRNACVSCRRTFIDAGGTSRYVTRCSCCERDGASYCQRCCYAATRHVVCGVQPPVAIEFRNQGVRFWAPSTFQGQVARESHHGYSIFTTSDSLRILGGVMPRSELDLRRFTKNSSRRFAAVEIEVDSSPGDHALLNSILSSWRCAIVHDGSVGAYEINTSPACGDALYDQLAEICRGLKESSATVGENCGLHVHVDTRDYGYQELRRLIKLYATIEDAMFAAVHHSRDDNTYTARCGRHFIDRFINKTKPDTKTLKRDLITVVYGENALSTQPRSNGLNLGPPRRRHVTPSTEYMTFYSDRTQHYGPRATRSRYYALNVHSYFMRGTIESRLHHGSTWFSEIYPWVLFLVNLFDAVYRTTDQEMERITEVVSTDDIRSFDLNGLSYDNLKNAIPQFRHRTSDPVRVISGMVILSRLLPDFIMKNLAERVMLFAMQQPLLSVNAEPVIHELTPLPVSTQPQAHAAPRRSSTRRPSQRRTS